MVAFKQYIAVLLFAVLSFAILPREMWHACDHDHEHAAAHSDAENSSDTEEECSLCDYTFASFAAPSSHPILAVSTFTPSGNSAVLSGCSDAFVLNKPSRAPPVM